jgi:hypothetical protein
LPREYGDLWLITACRSVANLAPDEWREEFHYTRPVIDTRSIGPWAAVRRLSFVIEITPDWDLLRENRSG